MDAPAVVDPADASVADSRANYADIAAVLGADIESEFITTIGLMPRVEAVLRVADTVEPPLDLTPTGR